MLTCEYSPNWELGSLARLLSHSQVYVSCKMLFRFLVLHLLCTSGAWAYVVNYGTSCYVYPESLVYGGQPVDDTPSILEAFNLCGINGTVILTDNTFHIDQIMNTTNLLNCNVDIYGTLIWSPNIPYWLSHSISVVYQDQ